jgi:hypothetical protein
MTAYRLLTQTYGRIKSKLLRRGIPGSVIISIMKWAGEPKIDWTGFTKWLHEYTHRVQCAKADEKLDNNL